MSNFMIHKSNQMEVTLISNVFIDQYMKEANDAQLKIYLYLLRMMSTDATSISSIADEFNYTEKDVIRALQYWEKKKVLSLEYNSSKEIIGLSFVELSSTANTSSKQQPSSFQADPSNNSLTDSNQEFIKPPYSAVQLNVFKECSDAKDIIMFAETYLKKQLTPNDLRSLFFIYDELHFNADLIDYLIQYCVERGKRDFRYIEHVAVAWAKDGITTPEKAGEMVKYREKTVYSIMKSLGKNATPTEAEMGYITRWTKEYAFPMEVISIACNRTVLATDNHRFEYAEKILNSWYQKGVHNPKDIDSLDAAHDKSKSNRPASAKSTSSTSLYNQFPQNTYDFDALERDLLSN